jgi:hypothetical protein
MAQNTLLGMRQLVDAMQEEGPMFLNDMGRDERRAFQELFNTCEDFMSQSDLLQEDSEHDGQPDEAQEWADFDPDC